MTKSSMYRTYPAMPHYSEKLCPRQSASPKVFVTRRPRIRQNAGRFAIGVCRVLARVLANAATGHLGSALD